jgi:SAM-dependent methyltransferase
MFSPQQLFFICQSIEKSKDIEGSILEIGCAEGRTTVFAKKYMKTAGIEKEYICVDTFGGFTAEDIEFEKEQRNKNKQVLKTQFVANKKKWVEATLKYNGFDDVKLYEADINKFDLEKNNINRIALCLIDVDLYLPALSALQKVYDKVPKGGIIIVDDCRQDEYYDGALQAYQEFVKSKNLPEKIVHEKLGIIEK